MKKKHDLMSIFIVGLVAIIGIIIMMSYSNNSWGEDAAGQASRYEVSKYSNLYCVDSDNGLNYNVRGVAANTADRESGVYKDYCRNYNSDTLVEYYCNKNKILSVDYTCPKGCFNGACVTASTDCGNGFIEPGERCDDGNNYNNDICNNNCELTWCGDAIIQSPNGKGQMEQCDDGNTYSDDTCDQCKLVNVPSYG